MKFVKCYDNIKLTKIRKKVIDMTNLIYQGKIIRQFWGKLIRQSLKTPDLQYVTWGGALILRP